MKKQLVLLCAAFWGFAAATMAQIEPCITQFEEPKKCLGVRCIADGDCFCTITRAKWGKMLVSVYDTQSGSGQLKYERKEPQEATLFFSSDYQVTVNAGEMTVYDIRTGIKLWGKELNSQKPLWNNNDVLIVRASDNSLIGYKLATGQPVWMSYADCTDGINYIQTMEDNKIFISSDKLSFVDLTSGRGMEIATKNMGTSGKRIAGAIGFGILAAGAITAGAMAGYVYIPIPLDNHRTSEGLMAYLPISSTSIAHLSSQVLEDKEHYYVADRKSVRCLDKTLNEVWNVTLPKKKASESYLYLQGDTLIMANSGVGFVGGTKPQEYGMPFLAAFRTSDGSQLFYRELSTKKELHEQNFVTDGYAVSRTNEKIWKMTLRDSLLQMVRWDTVQYGAISMIAEEPFYQMNTETFRFDSLSIGLDCVINNRGEAYRASVDKDPELIVPRSVLYRCVGKIHEDKLCLVGGPGNQDCWICSTSGEILYHFDSLIQIQRICKNAIYYKMVKDTDSILCVAYFSKQ